MPVFYFDFHDGTVVTEDEFGFDLDSVENARDLAVTMLSEFAQGDDADGPFSFLVVNVQDATGRALYKGEMSLEGTCTMSDVQSVT